MVRHFAVATLIAVGCLAQACPASAQALSAEQVLLLKAATVYVKVKAGPLGSTGSGFLVKKDGTVGYIVTNFHVIDLTKGPGGVPNPAGLNPEIQVVFDSGSGKDRAIVAGVMAFDSETDLAVLRVVNVADLPEPINLANPPKLIETMPVFVCGFPFGDRIGGGEANPAISIGPGSVSSIRNDAAGRINLVQLNGALNPGNSGGPVVTADGKLVGVAVSTIRGAGIGFAVPHQQVSQMLKGRAGTIRLRPTPGDTTLKLEVPVLDPYGVVKSAVAHVRPAGTSIPKSDPENPAPLPEAMKVPLAIAMMTGLATATLDAPPEGTRSIVVQVELTTANGVVRSIPAEVKLGGSEMPARPKPSPTTPDAPLLPPPTERLPPPKPGTIELAELNRGPDKFLGKDVEVDSLSLGTLRPTEGGFDLDVSLESGKSPSGFRVIVGKDLGLQLSDLGLPPGELFAIRLKGAFNKPSKGDNRPVLAVAELGFLTEEGDVLHALKPSTSPPTGPVTLAKLNRFPESYRSQAVTFNAIFKSIGFAGQGYEVRVVNENDVVPLNLEFYTSEAMAREAEELPRGDDLLVRLSGTVERVNGKTGKGIVSVSKVEVVDLRSGTVSKTLTSSGKVPLPADQKAPIAKSAVVPQTKQASVEEPADPAHAETKSPNWLLIGGLVGGSIFLLALAGGGLILLLVLRGKAAKSHGSDEEEPSPKRAAKKPIKKAEPKDEFPGFGV